MVIFHSYVKLPEGITSICIIILVSVNHEKNEPDSRRGVFSIRKTNFQRWASEYFRAVGDEPWMNGMELLAAFTIGLATELRPWASFPYPSGGGALLPWTYREAVRRAFHHFFHIFTNSLEDIWMALIILIFMFFDLKGNWTPIWRSPLSVGLLKLLKSRRYRRFAARLQVTACRVIKALPALEGCEPVLRLGLPGTLVTHTKTCGTWAPSRSALSPGSF